MRRASGKPRPSGGARRGCPNRGTRYHVRPEQWRQLLNRVRRGEAF
jgi:hypothetical protein